MILILSSVTLLVSSYLFRIPEHLRESALALHSQCLRALPIGSAHAESLEALVCGKSLENLELKHLLLQTSLIHIFIVSGSHFLLLHKILAFILRSSWASFTLLGVYAVMTLCQPPGVRSLLFLILAELSRRRKWFTSPVVLIFLSAVLSLSIFPEWLRSRSILMSLVAALVLGFCGNLWQRSRNRLAVLFATQSSVYLFMSFCLWGFSNLHPLGILTNAVLGPMIGLVLFPLALLTVALPFLVSLFDGLMAALIVVLSTTTEVMSAPSLASPIGIAWQWAFFLTLLMGCYVLLVQERRGRMHSVAVSNEP